MTKTTKKKPVTSVSLCAYVCAADDIALVTCICSGKTFYFGLAGMVVSMFESQSLFEMTAGGGEARRWS